MGFSSLAFAAPLMDPWPMVPVFLAGVCLAGTRMASGSLLLCVGLNSGFAAGSLLAARIPLPGWAAAAAVTLGLALLAFAIVHARRL